METTVDKLDDIRRKAKQAFASGELYYSIVLYEKIFKQTNSPPVIEDVVNYGAILRQTKQLRKASIHYAKYLQKFSSNLQLVQNACNCWIELKDFKKSREILEELLAVNKDNTRLLLTQGFTELSAGQLEEACRIFEKIIKLDPNHFDGLFNLAVAKGRAGLLEEALVYFRKANQLQSGHQLLQANIITILKDLNRIDEARKELENLAPTIRYSQDIKTVEASLLMAEEEYAEASTILRDLTKNDPHNASHWLNWSTCLKAIKYTVAPKRILQTAILWHPENIDLQHSFAQSMAEMGKIQSYKQTLTCWQRDITELSSQHIFSRQFLEISSEIKDHSTRQKMAQHWEAQHLTPGTESLWADHISISDQNRPLRIGYLSADWRNHPVGRFMLPVLKHHDKKRFKIWCIDSTPSHDWISNQLKQNSDQWINIKHMNGLQAARRISDEQLDVLIELGGFTGGSRVECLVHRPCPIQLSYLGYPAPTFLKCIDGWIGDHELFGTLSREERKAHQLHTINGGYMTFDPGTGIPDTDRSYSDTFRFGCFNHARKLTNETIELFCRVMEDCPQSTLHLKSISFHEEDERHRIRKRFEDQGINSERLVILEWVKGGLNHLACYNLIDAALDPYPYGGATTTAEALWMGVPVVTRRHSGMAGCLSTSLLAYGSQKQWIAHNQEEYLDIARELFTNGPRTKEVRDRLRNEIQKSALGDSRRLTQELESLYHKLHHRIAKP